MNKIKHLREKAVNHSKKYMFKIELKREYSFTKNQIKKVFEKWSNDKGKLDISWIRKKIKETEDSNEGICQYTELSKEISSFIYEDLIGCQKDKEV